MEHLFPSALLRCIAEDRDPQPFELEIVTEKECREAFAHHPSARARSLADIMARVALGLAELPSTPEGNR